MSLMVESVGALVITHMSMWKHDADMNRTAGALIWDLSCCVRQQSRLLSHPAREERGEEKQGLGGEVCEKLTGMGENWVRLIYTRLCG